jgi:DNA-binding IclR family transcriptional regulator
MAGVTEIANELSVHKSTVSRLLGTLEARGLVEQAASRGRYRLSYGIVQLAQGASKKHDITVVSRPVCDALAEEVGETVNVVVNEGRSVVTIDQVIGSSSVTTVNWVGKHNPLHVTSSGKVFLANMSYSIVGRAELETELAAVRKNGYASTFEEQEIGLVAIAAPIRDLDGRVIATLTVSGPTFRIDREAIPKIADRLLPAAAQISERNGYPKAG